MSDMPISAHIRWAIPRDMADMIFIENESFKKPFSEDEITAMLRQRNCIGMVAEYGGRIVGYFIFELHRSKIIILGFAVDPAWRNRSVGTQIIAKLKGKLDMSRRHTLSVIIRETNLDGALFLRRQGFKAELVKGHFDNGKTDGYLMAHRLNLVEEYVRDCAKSVA